MKNHHKTDLYFNQIKNSRKWRKQRSNQNKLLMKSTSETILGWYGIMYCFQERGGSIKTHLFGSKDLVLCMLVWEFILLCFLCYFDGKSWMTIVSHKITKTWADWFTCFRIDSSFYSRLETILLCWGDSRGTPVDQESSHKETWHHTLTQNLKAQVYGSSPHLYGAQPFHFYSMWDFTSHL